jgi:hypothetical protein
MDHMMNEALLKQDIQHIGQVIPEYKKLIEINIREGKNDGIKIQILGLKKMMVDESLMRAILEKNVDLAKKKLEELKDLCNNILDAMLFDNAADNVSLRHIDMCGGKLFKGSSEILRELGEEYKDSIEFWQDCIEIMQLNESM